MSDDRAKGGTAVRNANPDFRPAADVDEAITGRVAGAPLREAKRMRALRVSVPDSGGDISEAMATPHVLGPW